MRRLRDLRRAALIGMAGLAGGATGCTHYHYYGAQPQMLCEQPAVVAQRPVLVPYGSVCEVPSGSSSGAAVVAEAPRRGEVLVSKPQGGSGARRGSRFAWHRPNPENLATTRVEGGLDESAVR